MIDIHPLSVRCFIRWLALSAIVFVLTSPTTSLAGFVVDSWSLSTGVLDLSGQSTQVDAESTTIIENPFNYTAARTLGSNTATTAYDFAWLSTQGAFNLDINHHAQTRRVITSSSGFINFTPDTAVSLSIDASLNYFSHPSDRAIIQLGMFVTNWSTGQNIYTPLERGGTFFFGSPADGVLAFSNTLVLPAGSQYRIQYFAKADNGNVDNPQGSIDTDGYIHITLTPVPEPASLLLLGAGILMSRRRPLKQFK